MKQHPILFSTPMVQAILEGRKNMTRRIVKPQPDYTTGGLVVCDDGLTWMSYDAGTVPDLVQAVDLKSEFKCPYGQACDILYVRESHLRWGKWVKNGTTKSGKQKWKFVATIDDVQFADRFDKFEFRISRDKVNPGQPQWYKRSSLFLPKKYVRIFLEVTGIRVERLQDITEEGAIAEGVESNECKNKSECISELCKKEGCAGIGQYYHYSNPMDFDLEPCYSALESFETLWESINGPESWNANPWVWVVEFKRIEKP